MFRVFGIYNFDYQLGFAILVQCMQLDTLTQFRNVGKIALFGKNIEHYFFAKFASAHHMVNIPIKKGGVHIK